MTTPSLRRAILVRTSGFAFALFGFAFATPPLFGQSAQMKLQGAVGCAGQLEPQSAPGFESARAGRTVRLSPRPAAAAKPQRIVLSVRTNCRYRIRAELAGPAGAKLSIPAANLAPAGGTGSLASEALKAEVRSCDLVPSSPVVCVTGQRVSKSGNDRTPDNAVLIEFSPVVPDPAPDSTLSFALELVD